jgi:hypothetical protein
MTKTSVVDVHKKNGKRPEYDIYIGRAVRGTEFTRPSKWNNPFRVGRSFGREPITERNYLVLFTAYVAGLIERFQVTYNLKDLAGNRLGCWCVTTSEVEPIICHGQILMMLIRERGLE